MKPSMVVSDVHHLTDRSSFANQFLRIRAESHRAPGIFQQIVLAVRFRLTYKLYVISSQAEEIKIKVEVRWIALLIYPVTDEGT